MADSRSSGQPSTASSTAAGAAAPVSPQSLNSIAETEGPANSPISTTRPRGSTGGSSASRRIRAASIKLLESDVPAGAWAASSTAASKAPTLGEIRRGSYSQGIAGSGPQAERRRRSSATRESSGGDESPTLLRKLSRTSPNPGAERTSGRSSPAGRTTSAGAEAFPTVKEGETLQVPVEENEKANGIAAPQRSGLDGTLEGSRDQTGSDGIVHASLHATALFWVYLRQLIGCLVGEWIHTASSPPVDYFNSNRSQGFLEMVHYALRFPHHPLLSQCRRLGRYALLVARQRSACDVPADL